jgi:hypothetical protein
MPKQNRKIRDTQTMLIEAKKTIIERCLKREMLWKDGATILRMHPKALSRLKRKYLEFGISALVGKKPGPKLTKAINRTSDKVEELISRLA